MNADLEAYRAAVIDALNRMSMAEAKLARQAEVRGDSEGAALHEHGETCLRLAARAVKDVPCE